MTKLTLFQFKIPSPFLIACLFVIAYHLQAAPQSQDAFSPADGDHIVFIGAGQAEGRVEQGYLETMITAVYPDRRLSFRNLAWTGDEVDQRFRSKPFPDLLTWVDRIQPDHAFISYGQMEAFRGKRGSMGLSMPMANYWTRLKNGTLR